MENCSLRIHQWTHERTHTHPLNGPFSGTTRVSRYQKGKTNLDSTEARDSEWQWHQLGHMQVCISLQTDNHASTLAICFLQARCPSCCPINSVKALKANAIKQTKSSDHNNRNGSSANPPPDSKEKGVARIFQLCDASTILWSAVGRLIIAVRL